MLLPAFLHPVNLCAHLTELCRRLDVRFRAAFRFRQFPLQLCGGFLQQFERCGAEILYHTVNVNRPLRHLLLFLVYIPQGSLNLFQPFRITHLQLLLVFFQRLLQPLQVFVCAVKRALPDCFSPIQRVLHRHGGGSRLTDAVVKRLYRLVRIAEAFRVGSLQLLLVLFNQLDCLPCLGYRPVERARLHTSHCGLGTFRCTPLLLFLYSTKLFLIFPHFLGGIFRPVHLLLPEFAQFSQRGVADRSEVLHPCGHRSLLIHAGKTFQMLSGGIYSSGVGIPHGISTFCRIPKLFKSLCCILYLAHRMLVQVVRHVIRIILRPPSLLVGHALQVLLVLGKLKASPFRTVHLLLPELAKLGQRVRACLPQLLHAVGHGNLPAEVVEVGKVFLRAQNLVVIDFPFFTAELLYIAELGSYSDRLLNFVQTAPGQVSHHLPGLRADTPLLLFLHLPELLAVLLHLVRIELGRSNQVLKPLFRHAQRAVAYITYVAYNVRELHKIPFTTFNFVGYLRNESTDCFQPFRIFRVYAKQRLLHGTPGRLKVAERLPRNVL